MILFEADVVNQQLVAERLVVRRVVGLLDHGVGMIAELGDSRRARRVGLEIAELGVQLANAFDNLGRRHVGTMPRDPRVGS